MESIYFHGTEYRFLFPDLLRNLTDEEDADLGDAIRRQDRVRKPVVTDGNGGIIDGIHRLQWAVKLGLAKNKVTFSPDGRGLNADEQRQLCLDLNDTGRQDPFAVRKANRQKRMGRVVEARQSGESLRSIAEKEGVSKATVERDIAEAEATVPPGGTVEPADGIVVGKDKKKRKSTGKKGPKAPKPCKRCERMWIPACPQCRAAFPNGFPQREPGEDDKKGRKPKATKGIVRDKAGTLVPDHLRDVFVDDALPTLIGELEAVEGLLTAKSWLDRAQKLTTHYGFVLVTKFKEHAYEALHRTQLAAEALRAGLPHAVCPKCNGVDSRNGSACRGCRGYGFVPETRFMELSNK